MPDTLYLQPDTWDLAVDAARNIAVAQYPYSAAQNIASACRLWQGEAPYNSDRGVPYESEILGQQPPPMVLSGFFEVEAQSVPEVQNAVAVLQFDSQTRGLSGQIQCTLIDGTIVNV